MFDEKSYSLKMDKTIEVFIKELSNLSKLTLNFFNFFLLVGDI